MFYTIRNITLDPIIYTKYYRYSVESYAVFTHYDDVIMGAMASQITSLTIVYSAVYSDADQRKHQSSASLAFVRGIYRGPVNSPHKWPVTRKMFAFLDAIMSYSSGLLHSHIVKCLTTTEGPLSDMGKLTCNKSPQSVSMGSGLGLGSANERRRYIHSNAFSHWLSPNQNNPQSVFLILRMFDMA